MKKYLRKKFTFAILLLLLILTGGTFIYSHVENWSNLDSLYFTVVTVTTIGYGDIVPLSSEGKIFTILFSLLGVGMAFYFFTILGDYIYKKTFKDEFKKHNDKLIRHIESKVEETTEKLEESKEEDKKKIKKKKKKKKKKK